MYEYLASMYICAPRGCGTFRRGCQSPWNFKKMVLKHHMSAGDQIQVIHKSNGAFNCCGILQSQRDCDLCLSRNLEFF